MSPQGLREPRIDYQAPILVQEGTNLSLSKYGGLLPGSPRRKPTSTTVAWAGGSSLLLLISSATTVSTTGAPTCVIWVSSSKGLARLISPEIIIKALISKLNATWRLLKIF